MGKIYIGKRGSGKTTKLLRQAEALTEEGLTPVIVCLKKDFIDILKSNAANLQIDTTNFVFIPFNEVNKAENRNYFVNSYKYRVMIDELVAFITQLLGMRDDACFYATISSDECKEIKRSSWDKTYKED